MSPLPSGCPADLSAAAEFTNSGSEINADKNPALQSERKVLSVALGAAILDVLQQEGNSLSLPLTLSTEHGTTFSDCGLGELICCRGWFKSREVAKRRAVKLL